MPTSSIHQSPFSGRLRGEWQGVVPKKKEWQGVVPKKKEWQGVIPKKKEWQGVVPAGLEVLPNNTVELELGHTRM